MDTPEKLTISSALTNYSEKNSSSWFNQLVPYLEGYDNVSLTETEIKLISRITEEQDAGILRHIPVICKGPDCPFAATCPFIAIWKKAEKEGAEDASRKLPLDQPCPLEKRTLIVRTAHYADELNVAPQNKMELSLCVELAELDVFSERLNYYLSSNLKQAELIEDEIATITEDGEAIYRKVISPAIELKLKLAARRSKIQSDLLATRKAKMSVLKDTGKNQTAAGLMAEIKSALEANKKV